MVIDNYGNLIEEPFHRKTWCIEIKYKFRNSDWQGSWSHFRSYRTPEDVQKALNSLREQAREWDEEHGLKMSYRPARRIYRKIETGFHVEHLKDATENVWWKPNKKIRSSLRYLESKKIKFS